MDETVENGKCGRFMIGRQDQAMLNPEKRQSLRIGQTSIESKTVSENNSDPRYSSSSCNHQSTKSLTA